MTRISELNGEIDCSHNPGRNNDWNGVNYCGISTINYRCGYNTILSLSFEGPAKWFFIGIILYMILIAAIALTAVFYNHLKINLKRRFSKVSSVLAWIHLIGMNIGGPGAIILMIFAGLAVLEYFHFHRGKIWVKSI